MLPLWVNFPKDKNTFKTEDSFMVGMYIVNDERNLIERDWFVFRKRSFVYPITDADVNQVSIYLPGENTVR